MTSRITLHAAVLAPLCLVAALAGGVAAQRPDPPNLTHRPALDPAVARLEGYTDWYGVYIASQKVGVGNLTLRRIEHEGRAAYEYAMKVEVKAATLGEELAMSFRETVAFDAHPPYSLLAATSRMEQADQKQRVVVRPSGKGFAAEVEQAGQRRTKTLERIDYTLADLVGPEVWFAKSPGKGAHLRVHSFDASELMTSTITYRIENRTRTILDGVPSSIYSLRMRTKVGRTTMVGRGRVSERGQLLSLVVAGALELRLEPEAVAKRLDVAVNLFALGAARVDRPLGDASGITALTLRIPEALRPSIRSGPRQRLVEDESGVVLKTGSGAGVEKRATDEETRDALEDTVDYPTKTETVVALATRAVAGAKTPREKVERLVRFVSAFVEDCYSSSQLTVLDVIAKRRGDCSEHAVLFTALARAAGIPCRVVSGWIYMGDDTRGFGLHAWNEVVLDGVWRPVDPTWNEFDINATHIRLPDGLDSIAVLGMDAEFTCLNVERRAPAK